MGFLSYSSSIAGDQFVADLPFSNLQLYIVKVSFPPFAPTTVKQYIIALVSALGLKVSANRCTVFTALKYSGFVPPIHTQALAVV
jgi:hypothetical protein